MQEQTKNSFKSKTKPVRYEDQTKFLSGTQTKDFCWAVNGVTQQHVKEIPRAKYHCIAQVLSHRPRESSYLKVQHLIRRPMEGRLLCSIRRKWYQPRNNENELGTRTRSLCWTIEWQKKKGRKKKVSSPRMNDRSCLVWPKCLPGIWFCNEWRDEWK